MSELIEKLQAFPGDWEVQVREFGEYDDREPEPRDFREVVSESALADLPAWWADPSLPETPDWFHSKTPLYTHKELAELNAERAALRARRLVLL